MEGSFVSRPLRGWNISGDATDRLAGSDAPYIAGTREA
jgi:hypothetical protein